MTVSMHSGAPDTSIINIHWDKLNWKRIEKNVYRLQMRIAKAVINKQYGKVKSLQWLLVHSVDAKLLAVKRVTTTEGRKTAGVDGVKWTTSKEKYQAALGLKVRGYKAKPLRRIYIPKKNGKKRPLSIPTMKDRAMQTLYLLSLEPISETTGDLNSYGFRPKRSTHDAIQQCFSALGMDNRAQWILDADIQSCFDEISHQWLRENIMIDKRVLNQWLNSGFIEGNHLYETIQGTPQGGPISPMLANLVLDGLENAIHSACKKTDKVNFVRFADDFIVTAKTPDILNNNIIPVINQFLECRGLSLSKEKTRIVHIEEGFDFLGFNLRKYNGIYLTKPSKDSISSVKKKIKETVQNAYGWSGADLISTLNPIIRGWANYNKRIVAKAAFADLDYFIFQVTFYWTMRKFNRHKRYQAVDRYFRSRSIFRRWIFSDVIKTKEGKKYVCINKMMDTKIQRHIKIKSSANPFLPEYKEYFDNREKRIKETAIIQWKRNKRINVITDENCWV